jgi:hypothetical protein
VHTSSASATSVAVLYPLLCARLFWAPDFVTHRTALYGVPIYMTMTPDLIAQILRYHYAERWPVGTISSQLSVHRESVIRVLTQAGASPIIPAQRLGRHTLSALYRADLKAVPQPHRQSPLRHGRGARLWRSPRPLSPPHR